MGITLKLDYLLLKYFLHQVSKLKAFSYKKHICIYYLYFYYFLRYFFNFFLFMEFFCTVVKLIKVIFNFF